MTRGLTAGNVTEIAKQAVQPVLFIDMDFDSAALRVWSGVGSISWDSKTWLGAGHMGSISTIKETESIQAETLVLKLDGISSADIAITLTEPYQGRDVTVWLGFILNDAIIADPQQMFSGRMDVMEIDEGPETSSISVTVESRIIDLLKQKEWRYTHEDQQVDYPGDLGLEFVVDLQNKEFRWVPS